MISYIIRLIFQNQDESKNWMVELSAKDEILPTANSSLAFKIFDHYTMFEVSMVVFYPGIDMQPVIIAKASKVPDEDLIMEIIDSIKMLCDGDKLVYRFMKELKSKVS